MSESPRMIRVGGFFAEMCTMGDAFSIFATFSGFSPSTCTREAIGSVCTLERVCNCFFFLLFASVKDMDMT